MTAEFIKANREMWRDFTARHDGKKLLIEEPNHPRQAHGNAVFALVLNQSEGLVPVWLSDGSGMGLETLQSYVPCGQVLLSKQKNTIQKVQAMALACLEFLKIFFTHDVLGYRYQGVSYGDMVYDTYLAFYQQPTMRSIDPKLVRVIASIILRHKEISKILDGREYAGVLVNHEVGVAGGVLMRVALAKGLTGYIRTHLLEKLDKPEDIYKKLGFKPYAEDIQQLLDRLGPKFDLVFRETLARQLTGQTGRDTADAFSEEFKFYQEREAFIRDFGLSPGKKNVFVMLHSLNDQPLSHFGSMVFRDYYDWMVQTLEFAKRHPEVNWVFKQHPFIKLYPLKNFSFGDVFVNLPKHIIYIDEERQINPRSLAACADLVVTCAGSVGFELPALAAIPAVTAGTCYYNGLGFSLDAKTKAEYFGYLRQAPHLPKLNRDQQQRAQAVYIFLHRIAPLDSPLLPNLNWRQEYDPNLKDWYWKILMDNYRNCREEIRRDMDYFLRTVRGPRFKRFNAIEYFCEKNNL